MGAPQAACAAARFAALSSLPFPLDEVEARELLRALADRLGQKGGMVAFESGADELVYEQEPWWPTERSRWLAAEIAPGVRVRLQTPRSADGPGAFHYAEISPAGEAALEELLCERAAVEPRFHPSLPEEWRITPDRVDRRWNWLAEYQLRTHQLLLCGPTVCVPMRERKRLVLGPLPWAVSGRAINASRGGKGGAPAILDLFRALWPDEPAPARVACEARDCFLDLTSQPSTRVYQTASHWLRFARQDPEFNGVLCAYAIQPRHGFGVALLALYEIWGRSFVIDPSGDNAQNFFAFVCGDGAEDAHARLGEFLARDRWELSA